MAYTGSLNNLPILIRYCDTAEQKTRLNEPDLASLHFLNRTFKRRILRKKETAVEGWLSVGCRSQNCDFFPLFVSLNNHFWPEEQAA